MANLGVLVTESQKRNGRSTTVAPEPGIPEHWIALQGTARWQCTLSKAIGVACSKNLSKRHMSKGLIPRIATPLQWQDKLLAMWFSLARGYLHLPLRGHLPGLCIGCEIVGQPLVA